MSRFFAAKLRRANEASIESFYDNAYLEEINDPLFTKTSGDNMKRLTILFCLFTQLILTAPPITLPLLAADIMPRTKIRIATAAPSLSYFPIYAAVQKGFFARRGSM